MNLPGFSADAALYRSTGAYKVRADVDAMRAGSRVASQKGTTNNTPHATAVYASWGSTGSRPIMMRPISFPRAAFPVVPGGRRRDQSHLAPGAGRPQPLIAGLAGSGAAYIQFKKPTLAHATLASRRLRRRLFPHRASLTGPSRPSGPQAFFSQNFRNIKWPPN
jgi:hypothetical protein